MLNLGCFVVDASPPPAARAIATRALIDTVGVTLAGASEPAGRIVQQVVAADGAGPCRILGTALRSTASSAALANGTAAHAHDYDDMCFVSLAHPSAPLVAAALAAAERDHVSGRALLDAYVIGFELEARIGRAMNPRHYQRGWHCTSTLGTLGAAAAVARVCGLSPRTADHALAIAASEASGLKENFGSMVKPLHAGLAARNGVLAADLAAHGMTASLSAISGPQGLLRAMDGASTSLEGFIEDLGHRWEILETGITLKLYPSCAATHPPLDALLELRRRECVLATHVASVEVGVDAITPTVLLYERPASPLEGKFSMPFCAAAALVDGHVGLDTFTVAKLHDPGIGALQARVTMRIDPTLDAAAPPLTQARVAITLQNGRTITAAANGARGYPDRPASDEEIGAKFVSCATRAMSEAQAMHLLTVLRAVEAAPDVTAILA